MRAQGARARRRNRRRGQCGADRAAGPRRRCPTAQCRAGGRRDSTHQAPDDCGPRPNAWLAALEKIVRREARYSVAHDRTHHRRQSHRSGAAHQGRGRGETPRRAARRHARARGRARRQQSGERGLCRQQGQGHGRDRHEVVRSSPAGQRRPGRAAGAGEEAQRRSGGARHPGAIAAAEADRRAAGARMRSIRGRTSTAFIRSMPGGSPRGCRRCRPARRSAASSWPRPCMRRSPAWTRW